MIPSPFLDFRWDKTVLGVKIASMYLAATKYRRQDEIKSIQPLGSLFDQCMHLIFDTICLRYAALQRVGHSEAFRMHSNVE